MSAVCPYCRMEVDNSVQCPVCTTPHHRECWEENGGCTVFGCSEAPPDDPKISLAQSSPVAPPPLPGLVGEGGRSREVETYPQMETDLSSVHPYGVLDFFRRYPLAWDCVLVGLWGTAAGALLGSATGLVAGLCLALLAGQFRAIFAYSTTCLLFGQSIAVGAGLLALFFSGGKFAVFLRAFSQAFVHSISQGRPAGNRDSR